MKPITLNTKEIKAALPILKTLPGAAGKRVLPILNYILIERTAEGFVHIQATDLAHWADFLVPNSKEDATGYSDALCIHFADFAAAVKLATGSTISVDDDPDPNIRRAFVSGFACRAFPRSEWPTWPQLTDPEPFTRVPHEVRQAVLSCAPFTAWGDQKELRKVLHCVCLRDRDVYGAAGKYAAWAESLPTEFPHPYLIEANPTVRAILKNGEPEDFGSIYEDKRPSGKTSTNLIVGPWTYQEQKVDGALPRYSNLFPKNTAFPWTLRLKKPADLVKFLAASAKADRAAKRAEHPSFTFVWTDGKLTVETLFGTLAVPAETEGKPLDRVSFNCDYFGLLLKAGCTEFHFNDVSAPVEGVNGKGLRCLLAPLRKK